MIVITKVTPVVMTISRFVLHIGLTTCSFINLPFGWVLRVACEYIVYKLSPDYTNFDHVRHVLFPLQSATVNKQYNFSVAIHSAVEQSETLLSRVRLKDSILEIRYVDSNLTNCRHVHVALPNVQ